MAVMQLGTHMWAAAANSDLTGKLFYCAVITSTGLIDLAGDDGSVAGIIWEEATAGNNATIQLTGIAKVKLGAQLNAGVYVEAKSDGTVEAYSTGPSVGLLLTGGNSGDIVSILLRGI